MEEPQYDIKAPFPKRNIVYQYELVNCPGKTIVGMVVEFAPGGQTPPHRHGGASVSAYVLKGSVFNKMNDEPMKVIGEGGSWYEAPGCHHRISSNASNTEPAVFFVNFVLDTDVFKREGPSVLVQIDEEYREMVAQKLQNEGE